MRIYYSYPAIESAYETVQDEGSVLPQQTVLDFQGAGVTVTDGGTKTIVTIPGGGGTPAALTKTDDTNVTLTLGGTPATALLQAVSLTVGWTGTLADARIASAAYWNAKFTLPSLTAGSVLFSDGATIAQDNANFFWDDTNNRLGIGTSTPSVKLEVKGTTIGVGTNILKLTPTSGTASTVYNDSGQMIINSDLQEDQLIVGSSTVAGYYGGIDIQGQGISRLKFTLAGSLIGAIYHTSTSFHIRHTALLQFRRMSDNFVYTVADSTNGNWLFQIPTAAAITPYSDVRLGIIGSTTDNTAYGLKVQKSDATDNFVVRNDGVITSVGTINGASPTEMGYLSGVTSAIQTQFANVGEWIQLGGTILSPADSTTYNFGLNNQLAPATSTAAREFSFIRTGTVTRVAYTVAMAVPGTSETVAVYLRNITTATDNLIGNITMDAGINSTGTFNFTPSITIANITDKYTIKFVCPAWVTNPTGVYSNVRLFNKY